MTTQHSFMGVNLETSKPCENGDNKLRKIIQELENVKADHFFNCKFTMNDKGGIKIHLNDSSVFYDVDIGSGKNVFKDLSKMVNKFIQVRKVFRRLNGFKLRIAHDVLLKAVNKQLTEFEFNNGIIDEEIYNAHQNPVVKLEIS